MTHFFSVTQWPKFLASLALGGMLAASGCQTANYTGAEPSARSFNEDPTGFRDTYIGMDFNFAIDDPEPHVPGLLRSLPSDPNQPN